MKKRARVFILNVDGHDFEPAKEYSDVFVSVTEGRQNIFSTDRLKNNIKKVFIENDYKPAIDFLVPSGSPIVAFITGLVCRELYGNENIRLLVWNAKNHKYHLRDIFPNKKVKGEKP